MIFSLIILFFDKFFFLTYDGINKPMIFRAITLSKKLWALQTDDIVAKITLKKFVPIKKKSKSDELSPLHFHLSKNDSPTRRFGESLGLRLGFWMFKRNLGETKYVGDESESRRLAESGSWLWWVGDYSNFLKLIIKLQHLKRPSIIALYKKALSFFQKTVGTFVLKLLYLSKV